MTYLKLVSSFRILTVMMNFFSVTFFGQVTVLDVSFCFLGSLKFLNSIRFSTLCYCIGKVMDLSNAGGECWKLSLSFNFGIDCMLLV